MMYGLVIYKMSEIKPYIARAAKRPFHFWAQPFAMLFIALLLCKLLPISAVVYKSRLVQPLPDARVAYVNLNPKYAMQVLRSSMQSWRSSELGGGASDGMTMDDIDLSVPLGPPGFLKQGEVYPGRWTPGLITPLAQSLPGLLRNSDFESRFDAATLQKKSSSGIKIINDPLLERSGFVFPDESLSVLKGIGRCRFYVECLDDGSVVHVLLLDSTIKDISHIIRNMRTKTTNW